ncbi:uncharacterized protein LMH87_007699 [Akanthomyces muscarius]|uniref:Uncharacterized protein n=1 Tax=Akanthomyces muscarius TaxID=2231603 RepID=A0A9W8QJM7_AKAMU|nr:uncharacterized protein LMH87_007699 [Akanthomyces muscarius]KAJ4161674.1 hypothetical protein LMH87_007699 [Akanthomyces muscarius]
MRMLSAVCFSVSGCLKTQGTATEARHKIRNTLAEKVLAAGVVTGAKWNNASYAILYQGDSFSWLDLPLVSCATASNLASGTLENFPAIAVAGLLKKLAVSSISTRVKLRSVFSHTMAEINIHDAACQVDRPGCALCDQLKDVYLWSFGIYIEDRNSQPTSRLSHTCEKKFRIQRNTMSLRGVKQRHARDANTNIAAMAPPNRSKSRTLTWDEMPEWRRDNKYILGGYRREKADFLEILAGLTFLHNETCNVYTHLISALLLPLIAVPIMRNISQTQLPTVSGVDYAMFGIFFVGAECCLLFSAAYHLVGPYSHPVEQFWHRMDLLGIVIVTAATFVPGIYYIFFREPAWQKLHCAVVVILGLFTAALICIPVFRTLRWRKVRVGAYAVFGASASIPLLHGTRLYGLEYMIQYSGMKWYLLELTIYGGGACLYAFRIPECFASGKFDILCSSHQIFHVTIFCAMCVHILGLVQAFTACHGLDIGNI